MARRHSPTVRRRRLAAELRRMRERAGMSVEDARQTLGWSSGRLNHMEGGRLSRPDSSVLRDLLNLYGIEDPERRETILALGRQSKERGWWQDYDDILEDAYVGFEAEAAVISTYQPIVVPGLLQTESYAAASARASLASTEQEIERAVAARRERQEILKRDYAPELRIVLDETALLRLLPTPALAREQIGYLIECAEQMNTITLQVLPTSVGMHASMHGSIVILDYVEELDPSIVYLETRFTGIYLEEPRRVASYRVAFDHVRMDALSKAGSIEHMQKLIS